MFWIGNNLSNSLKIFNTRENNNNIIFNHGFEVLNVCCGPMSLFKSDAKYRKAMAECYSCTPFMMIVRFFICLFSTKYSTLCFPFRCFFIAKCTGNSFEMIRAIRIISCQPCVKMRIPVMRVLSQHALTENRLVWSLVLRNKYVF